MTQIAVILLAFALAGFIHSAAGFGSALVAMPLLTLVLGVTTAAPLLAILSQVVIAIVLYQNWHALHFREALRLIISSVAGIPFGLLLLRFGNESVITGALGAVLLVYACYALFIEPRIHGGVPETRPIDTVRDSWALQAASLSVGFVAGVLGGAYNTNGPPIIIYSSVRRWPKEQFKSIIQSLFIVNGFVIVAGHALAGLVTKEVLLDCLYGLPASLAGMAIGFRLDRRLNPAHFRTAVLILILVLGVMLIAR